MMGGQVRLALRPVNLATLVAETIETVRPAIVRPVYVEQVALAS